MQIKHLLLIFSLAFFGLSTYDSVGQCLSNSKITTNSEGDQGVIKIKFEQKSEHVQIEILDMLKRDQKPVVSESLSSVGEHREWTSAKLPASYYMILLSSEGCEPKFSVHTIQLEPFKDE